MIFSTAARGHGPRGILRLHSAYDATAEAVDTYRVRYQKFTFNGTAAKRGRDRDLRQRQVRQRFETETE
jgi:hypothetical protein